MMAANFDVDIASFLQEMSQFQIIEQIHDILEIKIANNNLIANDDVNPEECIENNDK